MIEFEFKPEKMASAIAYIAQSVPGVTKKQICKLLYFADKEHLLQYGRTITGDSYHALPQGHVPTRGLNMMDGKQWNISRAEVEMLRRYGHLSNWEFVLDNAPDLSVFSKSDLRALDSVLSKLGRKSAKTLEDLSHEEPSWRNTEENRRCNFELFFEGHPEASPIRDVLLEEQAS